MKRCNALKNIQMFLVSPAAQLKIPFKKFSSYYRQEKGKARWTE